MPQSIPFLETRFHALSPFSAHRIEIWGEAFPTAEHAYQAARILPGPERDAIKHATSPMNAWREGQKYKHRADLAVPGFDKLAIMEEIFRAKLEQHPDIADVLRESGTATLEKNIESDAYWGTGPDGRGENQMGKIWMELRAELKAG